MKFSEIVNSTPLKAILDKKDFTENKGWVCSCCPEKFMDHQVSLVRAALIIGLIGQLVEASEGPGLMEIPQQENSSCVVSCGNVPVLIPRGYPSQISTSPRETLLYYLSKLG